MTSQERLDRIPKQWGFNCSCALCSSSDDDLSASDKRLKDIIDLEAQLRNISPERMANTGTAEKLIELYKQERFETPLAKAYTFAAMENVYVGNRTMARKYSALAVKMASLWYGPSSEDVKFMEILRQNPEKHRNWKLFPKV